MTKHLQKQLKQQKQLLTLELPAVNSKGLMRKLGLNGIENHDDDFNSLDNGCCELGAVPTPASDVIQKVAVKMDLFLGFCYYISMSIWCIFQILSFLNFDFFIVFRFPLHFVTKTKQKLNDKNRQLFSGLCKLF